uniref:C3H1-type domain-containing protein n=1 Tax=Chenopodium quinoa TaxID=63459 RepID=A0A803NAB6_CHEQI
MPPKQQQSKADLAKKQKQVEDKTFGLKNKSKSKNVQKYVQSLKQSVQPKVDPKKTDAKKKKEEEKAREKELNDLFKIAVTQPKVPVGTMEEWDLETLEKAVAEKSKEYNQNKPTDIVCKHFLDAVEKKQYGWFWVCPNGGKNCHYRHALPPGYVLKSQMKALLEEEADKMPIEEEIEEQRAKVKSTTPMTTELFKQWKQKKIAEKAASMASQSAERAKNDRMSGRELFLSNASLFVDDVGAWDQYEREESENNETEVSEKSVKVDHINSAHGDTAAPSSSGAMNDDDDNDGLDDIDDDLDMDELEELEASLSRTSIQIKEPSPSA